MYDYFQVELQTEFLIIFFFKKLTSHSQTIKQKEMKRFFVGRASEATATSSSDLCRNTATFLWKPLSSWSEMNTENFKTWLYSEYFPPFKVL